MPKIIIQNGTQEIVALAAQGTALSEVLSANGCSVGMPCGGSGKCGKCTVSLSGSFLFENKLEEPAAAVDRPACRVRVSGDCRVTLHENQDISQMAKSHAVAVEEDALFTSHGVAIDIGTTTLEACLYGKEGLLAKAAAVNPQRSYGADVVTRLGLAREGKGKEMSECILSALDSLFCSLSEKSGCPLSSIDTVVITGNTAMLLLLTQGDVSPLCAAPFVIGEHFGRFVPANELGLKSVPQAAVYLTRCISAFVGGDITTAILSGRVCEEGKTVLLVDVGTNGEMALWHKGTLTCCSTAAGPAFEGACLSCGVQGIPGAIDHAWLQDGELMVHTIGGAPACGICGSGVIDLLACLMDLGVLDESGYLEIDGDEITLADDVYLTQADVRQVQLAKSAIRAGIESITHASGISMEEIDSFVVAGGFGNYLDLTCAAKIGLFPEKLISRCHVVGNAALGGAAEILCSKRKEKESIRLSSMAQTVELATDPCFMEAFIDYMSF
ncbi:MAG: DUF4445 domain-containing protein [Oscillospiraceae bacterium]|nr:DUF4445 domain-containing protein [Oscillospiraceae bacterium]